MSRRSASSVRRHGLATPDYRSLLVITPLFQSLNVDYIWWQLNPLESCSEVSVALYMLLNKMLESVGSFACFQTGLTDGLESAMLADLH